MFGVRSFGILFFFFICFVLFGCHKAPIASEPKTPCAEQAVIIDLRYLDGCKFLLFLPDGTKLLPTNWPADFALEYGMKVWVTYVIVEGASMCMAEDHMVEILCIEKREHSDANFLKDCPKVIDPMRIDWMRRVVIDIDPTRIDRYDYKEGFAYLFYAASGKKLYDCSGRMLCSMDGDDKGCEESFKLIKNQSVIWVMNN